MKTLLTYVYEALSKRFEEHTNDVDSLFDISHLNVCKFPELKDFFKEAVESCPNHPDTIFIYTSGAKYFKMPYEFTPVLKTPCTLIQIPDKIAIKKPTIRILHTLLSNVFIPL